MFSPILFSFLISSIVSLAFVVGLLVSSNSSAVSPRCGRILNYLVRVPLVLFFLSFFYFTCLILDSPDLFPSMFPKIALSLGGYCMNYFLQTMGICNWLLLPVRIALLAFLSEQDLFSFSMMPNPGQGAGGEPPFIRAPSPGVPPAVFELPESPVLQVPESPPVAPPVEIPQLPAVLPAPDAEIQEIHQDLIWENLAAQEQEQEQEDWAREHARVYAAVEAITEACEKEEAAMIDKAHILLQKKGITLDDPKVVKSVLRVALHDDWERDIDGRLPHFRELKRDFGTARCSIWNNFIDELRKLGIQQVNDRHKVD